MKERIKVYFNKLILNKRRDDCITVIQFNSLREDHRLVFCTSIGYNVERDYKLYKSLLKDFIK